MSSWRSYLLSEFEQLLRDQYSYSSSVSVTEETSFHIGDLDTLIPDQDKFFQSIHKKFNIPPTQPKAPTLFPIATVADLIDYLIQQMDLNPKLTGIRSTPTLSKTNDNSPSSSPSSLSSRSSSSLSNPSSQRSSSSNNSTNNTLNQNGKSNAEDNEDNNGSTNKRLSSDEEKRMIRSSVDKAIEDGTTYYLIDSKWYNKWKEYVDYDSSLRRYHSSTYSLSTISFSYDRNIF